MLKGTDGQQVAWEPLPKQAFALRCPARELLYGGEKGGGKALDINTWVPTPDGWVRHGNLQAGDTVYAPDGTLAKVLGSTGLMFDHKCYRVEFSDGTSMIADADHLWPTYTQKERDRFTKASPEWREKRRLSRPRRGAGKRPDLVVRNVASAAVRVPPPKAPKCRTTEEILKTLRVRVGGVTVANHSLEPIAPIEMAEADLPVPPYTLGAWLGDGTSASGSITTADPEILREIEADGFKTRPQKQKYVYGVLGLRTGLVKLDLLEYKRIPGDYMRGSIAQRLALLQGLMDTDGWAEEDGSSFFCSTSDAIFDGVVELARSLGVVVRTSEQVKTCTNSKTRATCTAYVARMVSTLPLFRLPRKLTRQNRNPHPRWLRRYIKDVVPVESVPVNCIKTDREDGLYIAGEQWVPTHNTEYLVVCWIPLLLLAHQKREATGMLQHKCRTIVFRKNLEDLKDWIAKSHYIYKAFDPKAEWKQDDKTWRFESGATITCRHLDGPTDHLAYNGQELVGIGFDQVEQFLREQYTFIVANLRSGDPDYHAARIVRSTANPGGNDWIIEYFGIDKHPDGGKVLRFQVPTRDGSVHEVTRAFVRARLSENRHLGSDYEAQLRSNMTADEVAMYLEGDFFRVAGSYFSKFLRPSVHFQRSRPIPGSWDYRFGIDWGSSNPACCLVGARDNDGTLWIVDELHQPGVTGRKFGEAMARMWKRQAWSSDRVFQPSDFWGVIDKQAMDRYGGDSTAAAGIEEWGFRLFEAKKDRYAGCNQLKERLLLDRHNNPRIVIFEDRCPNIVKALSAIKSNAPKDPEDYNPDSPYAHAVDSLRFLAMEFPIGREDEEHPQDRNVRVWDEYLKRAREKQQQPVKPDVGGYS